MASQLTFIGAGNMAGAIFAGLVDSGYPADAITATAPDQQALARHHARYGINITSDNAAAVSEADVVILAVKPQIMREVCEPLQEALQISRPLVISVAAGLTVDTLTRWLGDDSLAVIRCMPNTPAMVGEGAMGLYATAAVSEAQRELAGDILSAVGMVEWVEEERLLSAVTAIAGSAPAYFFYMYEALEQAGVARGLPQESARRLALQTAFGAARMARESEFDPQTLKRQVMSPNGTTEEAIKSLENAGFEKMIDDATLACFERAESLARELDDQ